MSGITKEQDIIAYFQEQEMQQQKAEEQKSAEATKKIRAQQRRKREPITEGIGNASLDDHDVMYLKLNKFLDVPESEQSNPDTDGKLREIYSWAKEKTGSNDLVDIKLALRRLQNKIGNADFAKLYHFIRLSKEQMVLKEEMKMLGV